MYLGPGMDLVHEGTPPPMTISGLVRMDHTSVAKITRFTALKMMMSNGVQKVMLL